MHNPEKTVKRILLADVKEAMEEFLSTRRPVAPSLSGNMTLKSPESKSQIGKKNDLFFIADPLSISPLRFETTNVFKQETPSEPIKRSDSGLGLNQEDECDNAIRDEGVSDDVWFSLQIAKREEVRKS